jgi:hypothetical protein
MLTMVCGNFSLTRHPLPIGPRVPCRDPENSATAIAESLGDRLFRLIRWDGHSLQINAATAQNNFTDRAGSSHVVVGGDQVNFVNTFGLEVVGDRGEVSHGIDSAIIEMESIEIDASIDKYPLGRFFGATRGNQNRQVWMLAGEISGKLFPLHRCRGAAQNQNGLGLFEVTANAPMPHPSDQGQDQE